MSASCWASSFCGWLGCVLFCGWLGCDSSHWTSSMRYLLARHDQICVHHGLEDADLPRVLIAEVLRSAQMSSALDLTESCTKRVSESDTEGTNSERAIHNISRALGPRVGIEPNTTGQGSLTPCAIGTGAVIGKHPEPTG